MLISKHDYKLNRSWVRSSIIALNITTTTIIIIIIVAIIVIIVNIAITLAKLKLVEFLILKPIPAIYERSFYLIIN